MGVDPATLPYRPCVGIALINRSGLVWVGRRVPKWHGDVSTAMWQMPQGGIDRGEAPRDAAYRELAEEVGTRSAEIIGETDDWLTYDLPAAALGIALKGRYRGQKQKWFAMAFTGADTEIDIAPEAGEKPEFDAWRWVDIHDVADLVVPFKRDVYREVVKAFAPLAEAHRKDR